jgi:outer membrane protein TolC
MTALAALLALAATTGGELFEFVQPGRGWTAQRVARAAVERSPRVASARARLDAARAEAARAEAGVLPRARVAARYTRLSEIDNDPLVDLTVDVDAARAGIAQIGDPATRAVLGPQIEQLSELGGASIEIPQNQYALSAQVRYPVSQLFLEIIPEIRAREEAAEAASAETDVARNVAALEAIEAFYEHARARSALEVSRLAVKQAGVNLEAAEARLAAKTGTRPDLLRFQARLAAVEREKAERTAAVAASASAVRTLAGIDGEGPLPVGELLSTSIAGLAAEGLVDRALETRDELRAVRRLVSAREAAAAAARGGAWPKLLADARYDYANPNNLFVPPGDRFRSSWSLSGILSWSPDGAWKATRDAARADAEVRAAEGQAGALRDLVRIEVTGAEARVAAARTALAASRRGLTAAEAGYRAIARGYALGLYDATDLIEAELQLEEARLGLIDAGVELRVRHARLRRAVGEHLWE